MRKLAVFLLVSFVSQAAVADDLYPPSWRGLQGSSWAEWEFLTPVNTTAPDLGVYPFGTPMATATPGFMQQWYPVLDGRNGVWPLSGEIKIDFPNQPLPLPYKDIYIQLTWEEQAPGNRPLVQTLLPVVASSNLLQEISLGGLWKHSIYTIRLEPNPNFEQILITGGINVDQLVIDTICIPEPLTVGLLAIGAVILRRQRA